MEGPDIQNSVFPSYPRATPGSLEEKKLRITQKFYNRGVWWDSYLVRTNVPGYGLCPDIVRNLSIQWDTKSTLWATRTSRQYTSLRRIPWGPVAGDFSPSGEALVPLVVSSSVLTGVPVGVRSSEYRASSVSFCSIVCYCPLASGCFSKVVIVESWSG